MADTERGAGPAPPVTTGHGALLERAIALSVASVLTGGILGSLAVAASLSAHSLGVLGAGLGMLADLIGSAILIWRFRREHRNQPDPERAERRASAAIACALALIAVTLIEQSLRALIDGSHPGGSSLALVASGAAVILLSPLAAAKRRTAARLGSRALAGDAMLSAIGAGTALLALAGLLLSRLLGLWWADRLAALIVAAIALAETRSIVAHLRAGQEVLL